ncbi:hypothetical protein MMC16_005453 [Acarospora aff. strigata]|nr:hypothetical protein [Acarospora aff. strigata]
MDVVTERRGTATWLQLPPATPPSPAPRVFPLAKPNFSRTTFHYFNIDDDNDEHIWHLLTSNSPTMPQEVSDIKHFIEICRRKDASSARIKRNRKTQQIKFKVRCHRFLYTLVLKDSDKADKLKQSLPPSLQINDVPKKNRKGKRVA